MLAMSHSEVGYPKLWINWFSKNNLERSTIAQYIKNHSDSKDTIYVWDQTAHLYQESGRLASSLSLLTPTAHLSPRETEPICSID